MIGASGATGVSVRAVHESDLAAALALIHAARPGIPWLDRIPELLEAAVRDASGEYLACIAERDGELAGVGVYGPVAGSVGTGALYAVLVTESARRTGVGGAIISHIARDLASRGARLMFAEVPGDSSLLEYCSLLKAQGLAEESRVDDYYEDGVPLVQYRMDLR